MAVIAHDRVDEFQTHRSEIFCKLLETTPYHTIHRYSGTLESLPVQETEGRKTETCEFNITIPEWNIVPWKEVEIPIPYIFQWPRPYSLFDLQLDSRKYLHLSGTEELKKGSVERQICQLKFPLGTHIITAGIENKKTKVLFLILVTKQGIRVFTLLPVVQISLKIPKKVFEVSQDKKVGESGWLMLVCTLT